MICGPLPAVAIMPKIAKAIKTNAYAYAMLTMALPSACMGMLIAGQTADFPSGLAYLVMKALHRKYRPSDGISKVEMQMRLGQVKMEKNEDISIFFWIRIGPPTIEQMRNASSKRLMKSIR